MSTIVTLIAATRSGILTSARSSRACARPSLLRGILPYHATPTRRIAPSRITRMRGFGGMLWSPVGLSAHDDSTSELLRTLSMMAASKPTSWLSQPSHFLSH